MECAAKKFYIKIVVIALLVVSLQGATPTVKPALCPTNKIAPHRRIVSYNQSRPRTFGGAFIDLLTNDRPVNNPNLNDLQEKPQEDDPDDCGQIEDYDETDLSSITPQANRQPNQRRQERQDHRHLFWFQKPQQPFWTPASSPITTTTRRPLPTYKPQRPTSITPVPPFWSGGHFQDNVYRPPSPENPSQYVKPVHEHGVSERQTTYWPGLVGGVVSDVVGASPLIPTFPSTPYTTPAGFTRPTRYPRPTKRPWLRIPYGNTDNFVGSFFDLLF